MRNRVPFIKRVMDEVERQAPHPAPSAQMVRQIDPSTDSAATPLDPLHLFVDTDTLRTLVADALEALRWSEQELCSDPARSEAWDRAVAQRARFLAWLSASGRNKVFIALYPEAVLGEDPEAHDEQGGTKVPA